MADAPDSPESRRPREIDVRAVVGGGAALALGTMLAALIAFLFGHATWDTAGPNGPNAPATSLPALRSAPQQDRAAYEAEKKRLLNRWEWIDRRAGIARIPVEDAMRIRATAGAQDAGNPGVRDATGGALAPEAPR